MYVETLSRRNEQPKRKATKMTVKELKEQLSKFPDDYFILMENVGKLGDRVASASTVTKGWKAQPGVKNDNFEKVNAVVILGEI